MKKNSYVIFPFQTVSNREIEVQTEDEQAFLSKQQQILQQQGQTPIRGESPLRVQGSTGKTPTRPVGTGDNRSPVKVLP